MQRVPVLSKQGLPLMPTKPSIVSVMLNEAFAQARSRSPFAQRVALRLRGCRRLG